MFVFQSTVMCMAGNDSLVCKPPPAVDWYFHAGQVVKNYPHLPGSGAFLSTEIYAGYLSNGYQAWHSHFGFPQVGVSLIYNDFGNDKSFGQNISVLPNITFRQGNIATFYTEIRLGFGLAFFNRHYDILKNPENQYIGSTITNISFASFNAVRFITDKVAIKAGISAFHFSNGHYQLPNIGMNIPAATLGIKFLPKGKPVFINKRIEDYEKKIRLNVRFGTGWHEFGHATYPVGGPKYPVYMATVYGSKRITAVNSLQSGLFINYYTDFLDFITTQDLWETNRHMKSAVVTVFAGHEFITGHFGFVAEAGINLYNPFYKKFTGIYNEKPTVSTFLKTWSSNKLGFQYYPLSPEKNARYKVFIGAYIKANFGQADFVEYAAGFTF